MLIEFVVGVLLAAATVWFVLQPIFLAGGMEPAIADGGADDEGEDPDDDFSSRAVAMRALREIEFDRATGKLSDADYDELRAKYTAEALTAMRAEEGRVAAPVPAGTSVRPSARPVCPTHGPRPEPDAVFCSDCGRRLGTAPGYCARCGSALEGGARYCNGCGRRVAA